jgi:hypothetical protein
VRLTTLRTAAGTRAARIDGDADGDTAVEIDEPDLGALLADPAWRDRAATAEGPRHDLAVGAVLTTEIQGLGSQRNTARAVAPAPVPA